MRFCTVSTDIRHPPRAGLQDAIDPCHCILHRANIPADFTATAACAANVGDTALTRIIKKRHGSAQASGLVHSHRATQGRKRLRNQRSIMGAGNSHIIRMLLVISALASHFARLGTARR